MREYEVHVGKVYWMEVSERSPLVRVRIDGLNREGGWDATRLDTGRRIRIKSPRRLLCEVAHP